MAERRWWLFSLPPEVSSQIETAYGAYYKDNRLECVVLTGPSHSGYVVHFSRSVQRKTASGYERNVRRISVNLPSSPNITAYWTWCENRTSFVLYNLEASVDIELSHLKGDLSLNLAHCTNRLPYTIDFTTMEQTRHGYGTRRKIKRYPVSGGTSLQSYLALPTSTGVASTAHTSLVSSGTSGTAAVGGGTSSMSLPNPFGSASLKSSGGSARTSFHPHLPTAMHGGLTSIPTSIGTFTSSSNSSVSTVPPHYGSTASVSTGYSVTSSMGSPSRTGRSRNKSKSTATSSSTSRSRGKRRGKGGVTGGRGAGEGSGVANGEDDEVMLYAKKVRRRIKNADDEPCPICMNKLTEHSGFEEDNHPPLSSNPSNLPVNVYKLKKCGHMLHRACLLMYMKNSSQSGFQCPTCKKSYGVKTGDMPNGSMTTRTISTSLAGHEGYRTIEITYNFSPGVYKGKRYRANAFPRTCYLPDSPKGQKVLKLLKVAWERKLTFTIGTSVTSGVTDTVVWNEIHHKTSTSNYGGHGYPDPTYLDRVILELAAQGVEDEEDRQDSDQDEVSSEEEEDEDSDDGGTVKEKDGKGGAVSTINEPIIILDDSDSDDL